MRNCGRALTGIWNGTGTGCVGFWGSPRSRKRLVIGLLSVGLIFATKPASAQTPIIIGPTTTLQWEIAATSIAQAQAFSYALIIDAGIPIPLSAASVTCAGGGAGSTVQTCKALAQPLLPIGSHSITLTAASGGVTSVPSAPFAYLTIVIPIPQGLRLVP